jgi:hypothetical protein
VFAAKLGRVSEPVEGEVRIGAGEPDDLPTKNQLPSGAASKRSRSMGSSDASLQFTQATLRDEEAQTALAMIRVGRFVGVACMLGLPFLGGATAWRLAVSACVVFAIAVGYWAERKIRDPALHDEAAMIILALSVAPAAFITVLFFGIFSAAQLFPAIALYFFSRRERFRSALALFLVNAIVQGIFATVLISGLVEDPGLFRLDQPVSTLVVGHLLIQVGVLGAFLLGRRSHTATREAIVKMQHAMLLAAQREALLIEARQDLDLALRLDSASRYTDQTFGGYRLGHVLGRGGMGEIYEGFHVDTGDVAAVKLLAPRELGNPHSVERFLREVRAVRQLTSPHVVRVLGASDESDPIPYLVMERLRGHDLAHQLRSGRMAPGGLVELLVQIGSAVEEAWSLGIVHRDLKPQNLFLADGPGRPTWKVLDFGVAALSDHSGTLTEGHIVGTPAYMAPEQARGERVDHRADVYALAAIAYRWLTGRPTCSGRDLHASLYQVVHVMPQQPSSLVALHADVDAALAIGLVKDPADRWASVSSLRTALAASFEGKLEQSSRRRAANLLARHPWGAARS